jgi:hypothetical protein
VITEVMETWPDEPMAPNGHHSSEPDSIVFEWGS